MGVVRLYMSMSLDGFVADRNGDVAPLYPDLETLRDSEALAEMIEATCAHPAGPTSGDGWTLENVRPPARLRLYRAVASEPSVVGPHDERLPVTL